MDYCSISLITSSINPRERQEFALGTELVMPDEEAIARTAAHGEELTGEREWQAVLRSLEQTEPVKQ